MEALDHGSEFLAHYGIKGMKWDASKKKSPAELLAEALKRKRKEALIKRAAATGTEYIRKKARDAVIDRLSASIASATTPRPSSPDNQHKTNQTYARRNLEESAKRVESEKRNQGIKKTKESPKNKSLKSSFNDALYKKYREDEHKRMEDFDAANKRRRMAEDRAMDAEKTRREKTHQARASEDKRLKEEARKKRRSDFDQYVDSNLDRRRKDNIRRALNKAAKSGTNFSHHRR